MKCNWIHNFKKEDFIGKRILVAGGTGFIGKRCVQFLSELGCKISVITRRKYENVENIRYFTADLFDINALRRLETDGDYDYAIYLAANIPLAGEKKETYLEAKCTTLDPLLNFCDLFLSKVKTIIYASSIDVLGDCDKVEYTEQEFINNPTPYGLAKYCGEFYIKIMSEKLGINYKILRFSQVYGPNEPIVRIIPILKKALLENTVFNLYTDGKEKRRFLYVDDAVQSILRCMLSDTCGVYNIAGNDIVSMIDLISKMEKVFDKKLHYNILNKIKGKDNVPSIEMAKKELLYSPNFSVEMGLENIKTEENNV